MRSARRSTRFPSRSAAVRSPTLFFAMVDTAHFWRDPQDEAARQRAAMWTASHGSAPRAAEPSGRVDGHAAARPARWSGTTEVEDTTRRTAGRKREAGAAVDAIVGACSEGEPTSNKAANCRYFADRGCQVPREAEGKVGEWSDELLLSQPS